MDNTKLEMLQSGRVYVLVTQQEILIRGVEVQGEQLLLKADQAGAAPVALPLAEVQEIWRRRACTANCTSHHCHWRRVALLEQTVQLLQERVEKLEN